MFVLDIPVLPDVLDDSVCFVLVAFGFQVYSDIIRVLAPHAASPRSIASHRTQRRLATSPRTVRSFASQHRLAPHVASHARKPGLA